MPILNLHKKIEPLNWTLVKDYLKEVVAWEDIEQNWQSYAEKRNQLIASSKLNIQMTRRWFFYNFNEQKNASSLLSYVKSVLPDHQQELGKANVQFDQERNVHYFRLTYLQQAVFNSLIESFNFDSHPAPSAPFKFAI